MIGFIAAGLLALQAPDTAAPVPLHAGPGADIFRAIERHYPDDYRDLRAALSREAPEGSAEADALKSRLLADFYRRRAPSLHKAPVAIMARVNERQLALMRSLARTDVRLCADFATSALAGRLDLPAVHQIQLSSLGALIVEAAKLGETNPRERQSGSLAEDDAFNWYSQLLRQEPSTDFKVATGAPSEDSSAAELDCRVGLAMLGAIAKLAPEQAANVGASFLAAALSDSGED